MGQGWGLSPNLQIEIECSGCGYIVWFPQGQPVWEKMRQEPVAADLLSRFKCQRCGAQSNRVSISRKPAVPHNGDPYWQQMR